MATPVLFTLHVQLSPEHLPFPIWRRIQVTGDCTLRKLHHLIQAAMGWHSCHLHEFVLEGARYMPGDPDAPYDATTDDRKAKLGRVLKHTERMLYIYDFGDDWEHVITVEAIEPTELNGIWCELVDGAGACPPEDVGGPWGYANFLQAINTVPLSEEGAELLQWAGGLFNAQQFDQRAANASVQRICNNRWA